MPFKRTYRRKYGSRRSLKRYSRKKYQRSGATRYKRSGQRVYYFKRNTKVLYDNIGSAPISVIRSGGTGIESLYQFSFRLGDLPNYTEFSSLYDEYRIKAVKVSFIPMANMSEFTSATGATGLAPTYAVRSFSAVDKIQDSSFPSTINALREYQNVKWRAYNRIHSRYILVKPNLVSTSGAASGLYRANNWFSTNSPGVQYEGLIFGVDANSAPTSTLLYHIEAKFYMQFRTPR